jgi:hypothetical protein
MKGVLKLSFSATFFSPSKPCPPAYAFRYPRLFEKIPRVVNFPQTACVARVVLFFPSLFFPFMKLKINGSDSGHSGGLTLSACNPQFPRDNVGFYPDVIFFILEDKFKNVRWLNHGRPIPREKESICFRVLGDVTNGINRNLGVDSSARRVTARPSVSMFNKRYHVTDSHPKNKAALGSSASLNVTKNSTPYANIPWPCWRNFLRGGLHNGRNYCKLLLTHRRSCEAL